jgi:hypothetical protein
VSDMRTEIRMHREIHRCSRLWVTGTRREIGMHRETGIRMAIGMRTGIRMRREIDTDTETGMHRGIHRCSRL